MAVAFLLRDELRLRQWWTSSLAVGSHSVFVVLAVGQIFMVTAPSRTDLLGIRNRAGPGCSSGHARCAPPWAATAGSWTCSKRHVQARSNTRREPACCSNRFRHAARAASRIDLQLATMEGVVTVMVTEPNRRAPLVLRRELLEVTLEPSLSMPSDGCDG
jgi:hypothetical protein